MEQLKYIVEDTTIAELLGVQNFSTKESAFLEIVKNSYDAGATFINISFNKNRLTIHDDGCGMNKEDIYEKWMHVGKSAKGYKFISDDSNKERVLAGSKGIGRFALARLGTHVFISSKKKNAKPIQWATNWKRSTIKELTSNSNNLGTKITIFNLRDRWTEKSAKSLSDYFAITYKDSLMRININFEGILFHVNQYFNKPKLGRNCVSIINLSYDNKTHKLLCNITSDEFKEEANKFFTPLKDFTITINMLDELSSEKALSLTDDELKETLCQIGKFSSELYFSLKSSSSKEVDDFLYKYEKLDSRYDNGVVLYRNAFSISSFEGKKDWLGFGKRSRKSPAAASHKTGAWRVRENHISGMVIIDKKDNEFLRDLSNRQGLEENEHYNIFIMIILAGISAFERYRQSIIRAINVKNETITESDMPLMRKIIKSPENIKRLTKEEATTLVKEIKSLQQTTKDYKERNEETEKRYKYDIRILNVFATSGLKAAYIAHELQNDKNHISENYKCIVDALKELDFWDELNLPENTKYEYQNVPSMLLNNKKINDKLLAFMELMLNEIEKQRFLPNVIDIEAILLAIKSKWEREYAWLSISIRVDKYLEFYTAEDVFSVIFDNLILNSLQQNDQRDKLNIQIEISKTADTLFVFYHDSGAGLPDKYIKEPKRILNVHESSRKNGHGIGMWVVNNTIDMTGGRIFDINGLNGFTIKFELGDKLENN